MMHSHMSFLDQRSYSGTMSQCFCMCNGMARGGMRVDRVTYFPSGQFSSGGCGCCPGTRGAAVSSSANDNDASGFGFSAEQIGNATVTSIHIDEATLKKHMQNAALGNTPGPFLVDKCFGSTGTYSGNYDSCVNMCKGYARQFIGGGYRVNYFPSGQFSSGGCSCCGNVDPCFNWAPLVSHILHQIRTRAVWMYI